MHPIIYALLGVVAIHLVATFLGYTFGVALLLADLIRNNPRAAAWSGIVLGAVLGTIALFDLGQPVLGCLAIIAQCLILVAITLRRQRAA
jgi:hypothetical protein